MLSVSSESIIRDDDWVLLHLCNRIILQKSYFIKDRLIIFTKLLSRVVLKLCMKFSRQRYQKINESLAKIKRPWLRNKYFHTLTADLEHLFFSVIFSWPIFFFLI